MAAVASALILVGVTGCASSGSTSSASTATTAPPPATSPSPSSTADPAADPTAVEVRPWWLVDDKVEAGDSRGDGGADPARAALDALMAGPSPTEAAFGASTAITSNVEVQSFDEGADGVVTVSFSRKFETADTRPQVAQVVYTLTELPQVSAVRFLIDGQPNGATGVPPITRADLRFPAVTS